MKATLIIDGNNLLFRCLYVAAQIKSTTSKIPMDFRKEPEVDQAIFIKKMATDLLAEARRYSHAIDQIVYCVDSSSWRKAIHPTSEYKAGRVKDETLDWTKIYEAHDKFVEILQQNQIIVSRVDGAEADDLIFYWTALNQFHAKPVIINSNDKDILQLVDIQPNFFSIVSSSTSINSMIGTKKRLNDLSPSSIFDMDPMSTNTTWTKLIDVIEKTPKEYIELDPNEFIFIKILAGDKGDNVPSIYTKNRMTKKGPQQVRFTENRAQAVLSEWKNKNGLVKQWIFFDEPMIKEICELVQKSIESTESIFDIIERWKNNRDLMMLHQKCIPPIICDRMQKEVNAKRSNLFVNLPSIDAFVSAPTIEDIQLNESSNKFNSNQWDQILN